MAEEIGTGAIRFFIAKLSSEKHLTFKLDEEEATVIGTLRTSGYSRGELLRHYMTIPLTVTLVAAAVGNLLGYTVFKNMVVAMYYNSYSLPSYRTLWNFEALIRTTIIPVIIMVVVNLIIISHKLRIPSISNIKKKSFLIL